MKPLLSIALFLTLTTACGHSAKHTAALESLKKLDAHTQTGVVRPKYLELLGDAKYAVNSLPQAGDEVADRMRAAMSAFEDADRTWGELGYEGNSSLIRASWKRARARIEETEELMKQ